MILVTTETVPGHEIRSAVGIVQGNTVRTKHIGRDIGASLKTIVGGEIKGYTDMLNEARAEAMERLRVNAMAAGANAVVNVRFTTADVVGAGAEILAYGTGVVAIPVEG